MILSLITEYCKPYDDILADPAIDDGIDISIASILVRDILQNDKSTIIWLKKL